MKSLWLLLPALLCSACATAPAPPPIASMVADARFGPPSEPVGTEQLFAVNDAMRAYLHTTEFTNTLQRLGPERGLIDALYKKGELRIEYDSTRTRTAAEAFADKAGNCLSLVIMTAAFARELNMRVTFQNIVMEETWSRRGHLYFASNHVNLALGLPSYNLARGTESFNMMTVDFLPPEQMAGYRTLTIDEATVRAMYANNRAAEALAQSHLDDAYWWARHTVASHPNFTMAYNTLGAVYLQHGDHALAEHAFRTVLELEANNTVAMGNLVTALEAQGRHAEARELTQRLARLEPYPPFHFYEIGVAAMERGDYAAARTAFQKEVDRAPYYHEFHFMLGMALANLGQVDKARDAIAHALEASTSEDNRHRYAAKLDHLKAHP